MFSKCEGREKKRPGQGAFGRTCSSKRRAAGGVVAGREHSPRRWRWREPGREKVKAGAPECSRPTPPVSRPSPRSSPAGRPARCGGPRDFLPMTLRARGRGKFTRACPRRETAGLETVCLRGDDRPPEAEECLTCTGQVIRKNGGRAPATRPPNPRGRASSASSGGIHFRVRSLGAGAAVTCSYGLGWLRPTGL